MKSSFVRLNELLLVAFNNILQVSATLFILRLLTTTLSEGEYGQLQLIIVTCTAVNYIIYGPLNASLQRHYAVAVGVEELRIYKKATKIICVRAFYIVVFLIAPFVALYFRHNQDILVVGIILAICYMVVSGQNVVVLGMLTGGRNRKNVLIFQGSDLILRSVLLFLFKDQLTVEIVLGILFIGALLSYIIGYSFTFYDRAANSGGEELDGNMWIKKIILYAVPFATWGLLGWAQAFSEKFFLEVNSSFVLVAHFSVLFQVAYQSIVLIDNILTQFTTPILYELAGDGSSRVRLIKYINRTFQITIGKLFLYAVIAFIMAAHVDIIVGFLAGEIYLKYIEHFSLLSFSAIIFITAQTLTLIVVLRLESNLLIKPKIFTSIFAIILNYYMSLFFGLQGTIYAVVIFSIIYLLWIGLIVKSEVKSIKAYENVPSNT